jgi:hypothetical protein
MSDDDTLAGVKIQLQEVGYSQDTIELLWEWYIS